MQTAHDDLATVTGEVVAEVRAESGIPEILARLGSTSPVTRLLTGASVYRMPVGRAGMNWQLSGSLQADDDQERAERLRWALEHERPDEQRAPTMEGAILPYQTRRDLAAAARPRDDPDLDYALQLGVQAGAIAGPFNPADIGSGRYRVLLPIAAMLLSTAGAQVVEEAHRRAAAYWQWAEEAFMLSPDFGLADSWRLEEELEHLLAAGENNRALDLIPEIVLRLLTQGLAQAARARELSEYAIEHTAEPKRELCGLLIAASAACWSLGDGPSAIEHVSQSIRVARFLRDDRLVVHCAHRLARLHLALGDSDRMQPLIVEADEAAGRSSDPVLQAVVLQMRAQVAQVDGDFSAVIRLSTEALALASRVAMHYLVRASYQHDRALIAATVNRADIRMSALRQAADDAMAGSAVLEVEVLSHIQIATALLLAGRPDEAQTHATEAADLATDPALVSYVAAACQVQGLIFSAQGAFDAAEDQLRRGLLLSEQFGELAMAASCCLNLAEVAAKRGSLPLQAHWYEQVIAKSRTLRNRTLADYAGQLLTILSQLGEYDMEKSTVDFSATAPAGGSPLTMAIDLLAQAQSAYAQDRTAEADLLGRDALAKADRLGSGPLAIACLRLLAANALEGGNPGDAASVIDELLRRAERDADLLESAFAFYLRGRLVAMAADSPERREAAKGDLQHALSIAARIGAHSLTAECSRALAGIALVRKDFADADEGTQTLIIEGQIIGDLDDIAHGIVGRILSALQKEDLAAAQENVDWLHVYVDGSSRECQANAMQGFVNLAEGEDPDRAAELLALALSQAQEAGDTFIAEMSADALADLALERGQLPVAQQRLEQLLMFADPADAETRSSALERMADIAISRANAEAGCQWWEPLIGLAEGSEDREFRAACFQCLAVTAGVLDDVVRSQAWWQRSQWLSARSGSGHASDPGQPGALAGKPTQLLALVALYGQTVSRQHWEEATVVAQQMVAIHRDLAAGGNFSQMADLAGALQDLDICLMNTEQLKSALPAAEEVAHLYRLLARKVPAQYEPRLASSLAIVAAQRSGLGLGELAVSAIEEAVTVYRKLAGTHPRSYEGGLASALERLGIWTAELGRQADAVTAAEEAVRINRRRAASDPGKHDSALSESLCALAWIRSLSASTSAQSLNAVNEALDIELRLETSGSEDADVAAVRQLMADIQDGAGRRAGD